MTVQRSGKLLLRTCSTVVKKRESTKNLPSLILKDSRCEILFCKGNNFSREINTTGGKKNGGKQLG